MSLDDHIRQLAERGTVTALERHPPALPAGVDEDIANLLSPSGSTPPAKRKARRS